MHAYPQGRPGFIDLLRHGEPAGGSRYRGSLDDPLSPRGWRQLREACGEAAPWDGIVSSPLTRCRAFGAELAERHGLPLRIEPRLREIGFGDWEGRAVDEILRQDAERLSRYWSDPVANPPPGGEPLPECFERVGAALADLLAEAEGRHLLVVGHGGIIRMALARVLAMPLAAVLRLEVPHACLSRLRVQRDVNEVLAPSLVFHGGRVAD